MSGSVFSPRSSAWCVRLELQLQDTKDLSVLPCSISANVPGFGPHGFCSVFPSVPSQVSFLSFHLGCDFSCLPVAFRCHSSCTGALGCSRSLAFSFWRTLPFFSQAVAGMINPALEAHLLCGLWTDIPEGGAISRACQPEDCGYMPMPVRRGAGFHQCVSPHILPLTRPCPSLGLGFHHPLF